MYHPVKLENREWPANEITKAPIWCSVDLRDGNQALYSPMTTDEKIEFFKFLVKLGFKEIEVGFPAASNTEFEFVRRLIDENIIPDDVTIQVLTQAREHIITKTVEAPYFGFYYNDTLNITNMKSANIYNFVKEK